MDRTGKNGGVNSSSAVYPILGRHWLALFLALFVAGSYPAWSDPSAPGDASSLTPDQIRKVLKNQPLEATPSIFSDDSFPKIDFASKDQVAAVLGPYTLKIRYFDAGFNEVQSPMAPGRYGAWVEIDLQSGATDVRHLTLFKTPGTYSGQDFSQTLMTSPESFGLSKKTVDDQKWNLGLFANNAAQENAPQSQRQAAFVAALYDLTNDPTRWQGFSCLFIEHQWWNGLAQKLGLLHEYPHLVTLPADYDQKPGETAPLIVFLHGIGERGTDLYRLKNWGPAPFIARSPSQPFIVVTPQCPDGVWWNPEQVSQLIDDVESKYRVDPKRVYLTGLSMGGIGTLETAAMYPQRFAAIAALSGGEDPALAQRLKTVPTWLFHGLADTTVPAQLSIDLADQLKQLGAPVKISLFPGVGHGGWDKIYADPDLYTWFLQNTR
jgi:predicted esterase